MGKLMGEIKQQMLEAHRQRDAALRGLEEQKRMTDELRRRNEELVKQLEAARKPGDAPPDREHDHRMQDRRPSHDQQPKPPVAELRGEMRNKAIMLAQEKARAEELPRQLAAKLETEQHARLVLEKKLAIAADSDRKLAETQRKLEKANEALTSQLRDIAVAKTESQRAAQQREIAEKSLAERDAEIKRLKEAMDKRHRQPKGKNKEN